MPNYDLLRALQQIDAPAIRDFFQVSGCATSLADLIERGGSRSQFLELNQITSEIYDLLRKLLNKKQINSATQIVANVGRLGGLSLSPIPATTQAPEQNEAENKFREDAERVTKDELRLESQYYPLVQAWAQNEGYGNCKISGGKLPGYRWENPDLISVDHEVGKLTRSIRLYVTSFEVKLRVEPQAVWQAAHYQQFSDEVYVAFSSAEEDIRSKDDSRIFDLAVELGLGVLAFEGGRFRRVQSPKRRSPDPARVEEAVANFRSLFEDVLIKAANDHNACFSIGFLSRP
jgi:hypothetical protein